MGFRFNSRGFIMPYQRVNSSVEEIRKIFVKPFPQSDTRQEIFEHYLDYLNEFKALITPHFTHWLDGSFMSKKLNPNDLDFVSFITVFMSKRKKKFLELLKNMDI
jgi:hypothetical protein